MNRIQVENENGEILKVIPFEYKTEVVEEELGCYYVVTNLKFIKGNGEKIRATGKWVGDAKWKWNLNELALEQIQDSIWENDGVIFDGELVEVV